MTDIITEIDFSILDLIRERLSCPALDSIMPLITALANYGTLWIALAIALLIPKKTRPMGMVMAAALIMCVIVGNLLLKNLFARERPFAGNEEIWLLIKAPLDYSFPSGHTMSSFASASSVTFLPKGRFPGKAAAAMWVTAALIGFSRLYLYVHFPSDVLGGLVIGVLIGFGAAKLFSRFDKLINGIAEKSE